MPSLRHRSPTNPLQVGLLDPDPQHRDTETNQRWVLNNNGPIRSSKGVCIDAGNNPGNGTPLKVWQCYNNYQPQNWVNSNGAIRLQNTNLCIDVPGGDNRNGARLQLWQCTGSDNQRVSF
ncbi:Extracellular exo-alpha-L-arabinofuranosidase [Vanrija pseudolonga]|uniref:Extracellular exo-alpha-L-arabinofuranosidase n=1 Tax=Vanrija pseudolonga TaxID=143232 RepID=A0AAF0Y7D7_9TREE|nr:Extracellular exo-alpha-L-arabinofuranosidase [Vanrija pseudolonga]